MFHIVTLLCFLVFCFATVFVLFDSIKKCEVKCEVWSTNHCGIGNKVYSNKSWNKLSYNLYHYIAYYCSIWISLLQRQNLCNNATSYSIIHMQRKKQSLTFTRIRLILSRWSPRQVVKEVIAAFAVHTFCIMHAFTFAMHLKHKETCTGRAGQRMTTQPTLSSIVFVRITMDSIHSINSASNSFCMFL